LVRCLSRPLLEKPGAAAEADLRMGHVLRRPAGEQAGAIRHEFGGNSHALAKISVSLVAISEI
jgi:hypothetical protein